MTLNTFVHSQQCRMIILTVMIFSLDLGDWLVSLNLQDAYFHIVVYPSYRCFLCFLEGRDCYQYRILLLSLCTTQRVFTKVLLAIATHLCQLRIILFPCLDDWLLKVCLFLKVQTATNKALCLSHSLEKSTLIANQLIDFIGATMDSVTTRAYLPKDKFVTMSSLVSMIQQSPKPTRACL